MWTRARRRRHFAQSGPTALTYAASQSDDASQERTVDRSIDVDAMPSVSESERGSRRVGLDELNRLGGGGRGRGDHEHEESGQNIGASHGPSSQLR